MDKYKELDREKLQSIKILKGTIESEKQIIKHILDQFTNCNSEQIEKGFGNFFEEVLDSKGDILLLGMNNGTKFSIKIMPSWVELDPEWKEIIKENKHD